MTTEIPKISITHAINGTISDESSDDDDNSISNFASGVTDVEDFNSHDEISDDEGGKNKLIKSLRPYGTNKKSLSQNLTDIEDYEASGSDEDVSNIPEIKLSFREFLEQGFVEEEFHNADGMKSRSAVKIGNRRANESGVPDDDENGGITDCENYNTSGDDISEIDDRIVDTNLIPYFGEMGCIEMADKFGEQKKKQRNQRKHARQDLELSDAESENINKTASDDTSDEYSNNDMSYSEADINYSDCEGAIGGPVSEVEDLLCSGAEEEINFQGSDTSDIDSDSIYDDYPKFDVKFIPTYTKERPHKLKRPIKYKETNSNFLCVSPASEGPSTDIEKIDDSQAEDEQSNDSSDSEKGSGIMIARVIIPQETQTDLEDFAIDNVVAKEFQKFNVVNPKLLPPAVREMIKVRENTNGDPVTSVEQLRDDIELGLHDYDHELNKTDEEIVSDTNPDFLACDTSKLKRHSPIIMETQTIQTHESVKHLGVKRNELTEEPKTDIEELFVSGTARKKRTSKTKTQSRNKQNRLMVTKSTSNLNDVKTDTEEINLSDFETGIKSNKKNLTKSKSENIMPQQQQTSFAAIQAAHLQQLRPQTPDPVTDIENVSADEDPFNSDVEKSNHGSDVEFLGQENYISTVSSRDALTERGSQIIRKPSPIFIDLMPYEFIISESNSQCVTDIEDVALQSDIEEFHFHANAVTDAMIVREFNVALEECCHSVVHETSRNSFDIEKEKDHIKGMSNQLSDAYTDVEYIEEEAKEAKED